MNKKQIDSYVKDYAAMKLSKKELEPIISAEIPDITPEDREAILDGVYPDGAKKTEREKIEDATPITPFLPGARGKYDVLYGKWAPRKQRPDPITRQQVVMLWQFEIEKIVSRGVAMDERQVTEFNTARRIRNGMNFTEQIRASDSTEDIYDEVEDPYKIADI